MVDNQPNFKSELNPQQFDAVDSLEGPLLILAGAGSGKTRVLTYRFANLVLQGVSAPENILAVTFTNKAAREMEDRVFKILHRFGVKILSQLWISTFHSICVRILRDTIENIGYSRSFTIYDPSDVTSQIKKTLHALHIDEKIYPAKTFAKKISWAKTYGYSPAVIANEHPHFLDKRTLSVYTAYEEDMKRANALDFDDLLIKTKEVFSSCPDILQRYQQKFQYIMVDEYQDTNNVQYYLIKMLAQGHHNLCVVGDEDQSIYSWRGADIQNILSFEKDFKGAKTVKLEENYRSTKNIVTAASHVIQNNTQRKDKVLFTSNDAGDPIVVREELDEYSEAKFVINSIDTIIRENKASPSDIAIFYRTNAQSRVLEDQLRAKALPYKIVGGLRFYERMEIKDALSYLRLSTNQNDDAAFRRVINVPGRGIGKTTMDKVMIVSNENKLSMFEAAKIACSNGTINKSTSAKILHFLRLIEDLKRKKDKLSISEFYLEVLDKSGYELKLKQDDSLEAKARLENLEELLNAIKQFEKERGLEATLENFLEEMALVSDQDQIKGDENCIHLMTLHISKGLEFPYVFIVGLEEGIFPSHQKIESDDETDLEEERRLAYVGMTRAEKQLCLLYAKKRTVWGNTQYNSPSRFIEEIPKEFKLFSTAIRQPTSQFQAQYQKSYQRNDYDEFDQTTTYYDEISDSRSEFMKGMKVRHPSFGLGVVYEVQGNGEDARVSILFTDNFLKTFVAKFARLERV
ncbi:MAG: UvrD-helicase domain-containing protein [Bdellovibrionales bacterium]|nr:UvrD-helicase domain-containing protein [Bdellovibrionales bacterium]